jgi:hypothetical protein
MNATSQQQQQQQQRLFTFAKFNQALGTML